MASNDIILLDGIIEQRVAEVLPSSDKGEVFEYLSFEQLLKDYDLSREEIESGWVDGRDDGGIDGMYTFVNGHLIRDPENFAWPKRSAMLEVFIITAKHHDTFRQAPLDSLVATLPEFLDLRREKTDLTGQYSEEVLHARGLFHFSYRRLAAVTSSLSFRFIYASRGVSTDVADNIKARAAQITEIAESLFSSSKASFEFSGASELVTLYRRMKTFSLSLRFLEYLSRAGDSYVVLAKLADYCAFVSDENGQLRRYLFDSNVRDYLGENTVNEDIGLSLRDEAGPEFWWLNNGVTILATGATVLGKAINLQDVQIVNGLQTTESIFRHFSAGAKQSLEKGLLVKVVVSTNTAVRDQIIRATNFQSVVEPQSLHATDKVQRDIEEILERYGWFYERRKNYYRNIGKPASRFVTPLYLAGGFVGLVMHNPSAAATLKSRFMRNPTAYSTVFSENTPLEVWPAIAEVLKRSEDVLEKMRPDNSKGERFLARSRNLLGITAVARLLGKFSYGAHDLINLDKSKLTAEFLAETWRFVVDVRRQQNNPDVFQTAARTFHLDGIMEIGRRKLPSTYTTHTPVTESLIELVDSKLPAQPWKPGIHFEIGKQLKVRPAKVASAIEELIARGKWHTQEDGVVYDREGKVIAFDPERVSEERLNDFKKTGLL